MEVTAASVDITPSQLLPTACHGPFNVPSRAVVLPFEANILALRADGRTLVMVSLDWFFSSPGLRARILERSAGLLDEASLFVAASHAHTSPATDPTKVGFSAVDPGYIGWAENAIADRVAEVLRGGQWQPARLRFATTACDPGINRRHKIWWPKESWSRRVMFLHPNPSGPRDRELRLLRVEDEAGQLLSVIWGISCHPTEWPQYRELSSDYPGGVRQALRTHLGSPIPVLFLQGFCGDLRPRATGWWMRRGSWKRRLLLLVSHLVNGPGFTGFTPAEYRGWMESIAAAAQRAAGEAAKAPPLATQLVLHRTSIALSDLGLSGETSRVTFHWFDLSDQLRVTGLSAEPCWAYAQTMQQAFRGKTVWPVGYIDSVFGYLPTQAMLPEGGYEVKGFRELFGIQGEFVSNLEETIGALVSS